MFCCPELKCGNSTERAALSYLIQIVQRKGNKRGIKLFFYNMETQEGSLSIFIILILQFHVGVGQERSTSFLSKKSALTRKKSIKK